MSRVYEPVRVGATGACGCGYGLELCNPCPTRTRDMGLTAARDLPVSVIKSHAVDFMSTKRAHYNNAKTQVQQVGNTMEHEAGV